MTTWSYRAYDAKFHVVDGTRQANNFLELALTLRNNGLQIIEANTISTGDKLALDRLTELKKRVALPADLGHKKRFAQTIHHILEKIICYFAAFATHR